MALPLLPLNPNTPIPNNPFYSPESWGIYTPNGYFVIGSGLSISPAGVISSTGGSGGPVSSILAGTGISVSGPTGAVTVTNAGVTSIIAGAGISISSGTGAVTINSSATGTVTAVVAGAGLSGGTITTSGVISLPLTGVTAATYVNPTISVDGYGRILTATSGTAVTAVTGTAPILVTPGTSPTVSIAAATTASCGAVRLSDATNSSSSSTAATSLAVRTAYDIAVAAVPKTCLTNVGDILTATGPSTVYALPVGTDGKVLTACGACFGGLTWATPSGGGGGAAMATPTALGTVYGCICVADGNVGIGYETMCGGTVVFNTAIGDCTLQNQSFGSENTAIGYSALQCNSSGQNTAVGAYALSHPAANGNNNVALGFSAGSTSTTGEYNVLIGSDVNASSPSACCELAIGYSINKCWLTGNPTLAIKPGAGIIDSVNSCGNVGQYLWTTGSNAIIWASSSPSDARDKEILGPVPTALPVIQQIEPITYHWKDRETNVAQEETIYGFSAQQLQEVDSVLVDDTDPDHLRIHDRKIVPLLVKAIQELSAKVDELEAKLEAKG